MANKLVEAMVMGEVKEDTTRKMKMVTQMDVKEGAIVLGLKTSHIYNVSNEQVNMTGLE